MTLKDYRLATGLTQKQLAEKLGVAYQQVQRYEREDSPADIPHERLVKYAEALGVSVEALLSGKEAVTLYDLTQQESGIIIWDSGAVIVANWSDCGDDQIPLLSPLGTLVPWGCGSITIEGTHHIEDIRTELPGVITRLEDDNEGMVLMQDGMELLYDYNGDIAALFGYDVNAGTEINDIEPTEGEVYDLTAGNDHIVVIAPDGWN